MSAPSGSRTHQDLRLRLLTAVGILLGMLVCVQQITQPDYNTKVRNPWNIILPVTIPLVGAFLWAAWRGWRTRIETDGRGVRAVRIAQWPRVPWEDVAGIEVIPTPARWGYRIMVRLHNRRLVRLMTLPVTPRLPFGRSLAAARGHAKERAERLAAEVAAARPVVAASAVACGGSAVLQDPTDTVGHGDGRGVGVAASGTLRTDDRPA